MDCPAAEMAGEGNQTDPLIELPDLNHNFRAYRDVRCWRKPT
jgi:hypothetical protein